MKYLLDTNTISYLMKGTSPSLARAIAALSFKETFTSVIVEAELLTGLNGEGPPRAWPRRSLAFLVGSPSCRGHQK